MKKYKYVAYDAASGEYEQFETFEDAKKWLLDDQDFSEGIPEEMEAGQCFIAKISHVTKVEITDHKDNYPCNEEWPHNADFDYVGNVILEEIK